MLCQDVMKRNVEFVAEHETVQAAAFKMMNANVGFLPVCDRRGRVRGTITDRDIAIRACAADRRPSETTVGEVMTREVVACRPTDPLHEAERLMGERHKSRLIITDPKGYLRGVISLSDIAVSEENGQAAQTLREVASREVA
jgi:CBS domain-containing protein